MSALPSTPPPGVGKDAVASRLADAHRSADPAIIIVFRVEAPGRENDPKEPIKLLEVNPNTTASGIMPVWLSPHPPSGIFFPSVIIEVHPSEWAQIQRGELVLPNGWRFDAEKPL